MGAACLALLAPRVAGAEVPLDLSWSAPAGCPQAGDVRERIRAIAGDALRGMTRLRAEGRIVRADDHYRLTLRVYEGDVARDRTIDSASCADLAGAAAVSLGLLLRGGNKTGSESASQASTTTTDPSAAEGDGSDGSKTAPSPEASRSSAPTASSRTETAAPPPSAGFDSPSGSSSGRRWQVFLRVPALALQLGRLPAPSFGLGAGMGLRYEHWRFGVDAFIFRDQSLWSSQFPEIGVEVSPRLLSLSACRGLGGATWELAPCLVLGVDQTVLRGVGPNVTARRRAPTSVAVGVGGAARLYFSPWLALVSALTLGVETDRPRVAIGGLGEVRQFGAVKLDLSLGAEWIF